MTLYLVGAGIFLCLLCSAFFSATEMSYSSCNLMRLENLSEEGSRRAGTAFFIAQHFDDALSTILIGNNLANIAASSLGSVFLVLLLGKEKGEQFAWVSTVVITLLVIVFGETIPKISAKKNANRFSLRYAYVIRILMIVLFPVVWVVVKLIRVLSMPFKGSAHEDSADEKVEELQSIIETAEDEDVIDEDQSELVRSAIDFSDVSAYEAMTARVDVYAIDIDDDWENILELVENSPYSRIPVYEGNIDNVIGILYMNHFLKALADDSHADMRGLLMQPVYIYKTMKLPDVLSKLRRSRQHLAVVADEYGGFLGVISMEDVLEEIVGDIWDENDVVEQEIVRRGENELEFDGDVPISEFCEVVGLKEDDLEADSDTVGGWTIEMFGEFPRQGDSFEYEDISLTVILMDKRRVEKVLVKINR